MCSIFSERPTCGRTCHREQFLFNNGTLAKWNIINPGDVFPVIFFLYHRHENSAWHVKMSINETPKAKIFLLNIQIRFHYYVSFFILFCQTSRGRPFLCKRDSISLLDSTNGQAIQSADLCSGYAFFWTLRFGYPNK